MNMTTILIYAVAAIIGFYAFKFILKLPFYLLGIAFLCGLGWFVFYYLFPLLGN